MTDLPAMNSLDTQYIPSSSEKKQAVLMYMMVGLLLSTGKKEVSPYTHHHIKQSMGWIVLLVSVIFLDVVLIILGMFIGLFNRLALLITLPVLLIGILCIKQARDGKFQRNDLSPTSSFFSAFAWLGTWILNLFDADHYTTTYQQSLDNNEQITNLPPDIGIDLSQYELNNPTDPLTPPNSTGENNLSN